ncbi:hypothetical protein BDP55DRAFT_638402 [Colletotrichum godetiae]|uniref:Uncharacterized protein n=1 Tax=Colletotrichum godetiae TaxID=1209918 RepID=A0AAJ0ENS7_9PEZI|nr:uncharacterized protein BDP55DRAFT_638402 [Colletotrichum godetiae]KAK1657887.1 hypothetical protein BDP55DRAFT_638402 [Colletotrichum godetiae]
MVNLGRDCWRWISSPKRGELRKGGRLRSSISITGYFCVLPSIIVEAFGVSETPYLFCYMRSQIFLGYVDTDDLLYGRGTAVNRFDGDATFLANTTYPYTIGGRLVAYIAMTAYDRASDINRAGFEVSKEAE